MQPTTTTTMAADGQLPYNPVVHHSLPISTTAPTDTAISNSNLTSTMTNNSKLVVSLLDYGAGNVRSVRNAITSCGYTIIDITEPSQIDDAQVIIFPGVGSYHSAMEVLQAKGYDAALREYLSKDRPYLGICLGMQTLFESSEESIGTENGGKAPSSLPGLGVIPGKVIKFDDSCRSVPHIGWNGTIAHQVSPAMKYMMSEDAAKPNAEVYFVHSYYAPITSENAPWVLTRTTYEGQEYISSVQKGNVVATQFHPEKSGKTGLNFIKGFLEVSIFIDG